MNLLTTLNLTTPLLAADLSIGTAIAIAVACICMACSGLGEAFVCSKAIDGMARNPEMYGKLRTGMILGCALTETTAIYALLLSILMLYAA